MLPFPVDSPIEKGGPRPRQEKHGLHDTQEQDAHEVHCQAEEL